MKTLISYLYHLITWLFVFIWSKLLDAWPVVKKFLFNWNEILTIPLALVLWYISPIFLRWLDPVAATFDSGVLQVYLLAAIGLLFFNGVAWLILKINFPGLYRYIDNELERDVMRNPSLGEVTERDKMFHLTTYQKCVLSLSVLALYLLALVLLVKVM